MTDPQVVVSTCHYLGFCALKTADQAAWASAIGSIAAAVVALGIALSGGIVRQFQRRSDGRALAAYLATDLFAVYQTLEKAIDYIESFLNTGEGLLKNDLFAFAASTNGDLAGSVLESKVDQYGKLPSGIGEELAGAVGSLEACRRAVSAFAGNVRNTKPADWAELCRPILEQLRQTKGNMRRAKDHCCYVEGDR
jgi:hypothetical protein